MVNIYAFIKAVTWRVFNGFFLLNPELISTSSLVWTWQSFFAQLNGALLLTINRFLAIVHPELFETVFTPERTNRFIAVQWISSLIVVVPRMFFRNSYVYLPDNATLTIQFTANDSYYFHMGNTYCFGLAVLTLVLYLRMAVHVYVVQRQVAPMAANPVSGAELRLAGVGLVVGATLFFFGSYAGLMLIVGLNLSAPGLQALYFISVDVFNEINPYTLILLCQEVRDHLKLTLGIKPKPVAPANQGQNRSNKSKTASRGQAQ